MIPVALPTYNRPQYLKQTLSWLEANKLAGEILLVTSEEPNKECQELITNCRLAKERTINSKRLGLCANVCQAISKAAEKSDWFVCVEDDVLIGYDALELAKNRIETNEAQIVSFENTDNDYRGLTVDYLILKDNWFHCHGWACLSNIWREFMEHFDPHKNPHQSWANPFNYFISKQDFIIETPAVSRSYYIGEHGEFSNPEKYKKHVPYYWIGNMANIGDNYRNFGEKRRSAPSKGYILNECKVFYERSRKV